MEWEYIWYIWWNNSPELTFYGLIVWLSLPIIILGIMLNVDAKPTIKQMTTLQGSTATMWLNYVTKVFSFFQPYVFIVMQVFFGETGDIKDFDIVILERNGAVIYFFFEFLAMPFMVLLSFVWTVIMIPFYIEQNAEEVLLF